MKKILILGSNGNLANHIINESNKLKKKIEFVKINRGIINFNNLDSAKKLKKILNKNKPDVIINCIGIFKSNDYSFDKIFRINTKVSWDIVDYYRKLIVEKSVNIIFIGSNAHNKPRKNYILYVASKSALNSISKSAQDFFRKTKVKIIIYNPPAMKSPMRKNFMKKNKTIKFNKNEIDPIIVARDIIKKI